MNNKLYNKYVEACKEYNATGKSLKILYDIEIEAEKEGMILVSKIENNKITEIFARVESKSTFTSLEKQSKKIDIGLLFDEFITLCECYNNSISNCEKTLYYGKIYGYIDCAEHIGVKLNVYRMNNVICKAYIETNTITTAHIFGGSYEII